MKNFIVFIAAIILCTSCENSESDIKALNTKSVQKDEAVMVESYLSQKGKVKAKLTSPLMLRIMAATFSDTPYVEFPKTLHVDFFNDEKTIESRLDSKYGKYFESLNKVYLKDSVKVVSAKGDTLTCDDLWWDQDKQLFYTDRPATLKSLTALPIYGKNGLEATQDFKRITFKQVEDSRLLTDGEAIPGRPATTAPAADTAAQTR
ncbi:MAG: LPS export ABC transporter periplasmic protein LptC [Niabella sp.]